MKKFIALISMAVLMTVASFGQCIESANAATCSQGYSNMETYTTYRFYTDPVGYELQTFGGFNVSGGDYSVSATGGSPLTGIYWMDIQFEECNKNYLIDYWYQGPPYCTRLDADTRIISTPFTNAPPAPSGPSEGETYGSSWYTTTSGYDDYQWSVTGGGYSLTDHGDKCVITFVTTGTFTVKVKRENSCGWSSYSAGKTVVVDY